MNAGMKSEPVVVLDVAKGILYIAGTLGVVVVDDALVQAATGVATGLLVLCATLSTRARVTPWRRSPRDLGSRPR